MRCQGIGAGDGRAIGTVAVFRHREGDRPAPGIPDGVDLELEMQRFQEGRRLVAEDYARLSIQMARQFGPGQAGILEGCIEILNDPEIEMTIRDRVGRGTRAETAAEATFADLAEEFSRMEGGYMRQRASDLAELGQRLAAAILGGPGDPLPSLAPGCILIADHLSIAETVQMDLSRVQGLAVDQGGTASHVAILARSLGIPCVVGTGALSAQASDGQRCAIDGRAGIVLLDPDEPCLEDFRRRIGRDAEERDRLRASADRPAVTRDGLRIPVRANIGSAREADGARRNGADGIGLFRTEFLYQEDPAWAGEEHQYAVYRQCLAALEGAPLTIRSLDAGGDKAFPALGLGKEDNPFLGYRAIRIGLDRPELLKPQLRAVLRAAAHGPVELMFPMVISLEELRRLKALVAECRSELAAAGLAAGLSLPVGIMVETPAAAILAQELGAEADFFSIGTNDLTQYALAVDRGNSTIAALYDPFHPAVVRLIRATCEAARRNGIPACVCGEFAADEHACALLIGLGATGLSVAPSLVPAVKDRIRQLDGTACRRLAEQALDRATVAEIRNLVGAGEIPSAP